MAPQPIPFPGQPTPDRFFNCLPDWILQSDAYANLPLNAQRLLQVIANKCDRPENPGGDLMVAFGGEHLWKTARISRATFWRLITLLERTGFIVTLVTGRAPGKSNQYAIPGKRGSLNGHKRRREMRMMVKGIDGKLRPKVIEPGQQVDLWPDDNQIHGDPTEGGGQGSVYPETRRLTVRRPPSHGEAQPYPEPYPMLKNHARSGSKGHRNARKKRQTPHITKDVLEDTGRLLELFGVCVKRGLVEDCERDQLRFVAAAERALRMGKDCCRMFAWTVNNGHWLLANCDEELAAKRIRAHLWGTRSEWNDYEQAGSPRETPALSEDAQFVRSALSAGRSQGYACSKAVYRQLRTQGLEWTLERWNAALGELEQERMERLKR